MASDDWEDGDWHHIDFPALRLEDLSDGTTREVALWPERFPLTMLEKMRRRDPRDFAALYQQQPYIQGGNLIKTQWFNLVPKADIPPTFHTTIMAADTAFKTKQQNDPSVILTAAVYECSYSPLRFRICTVSS